MDLETNEVSWSDEVYRIHELPPGTEIGIDEGIEFYVAAARSTIREAFERCVEEREPYDLELPLITAKGNRRWVRTVGAPVEGEDDEIVKVAGAFQDITDRKHAEETLRKERDRFETLFQNLPTPVVHGEPDEEGRLRIRAVNQAFEEVFGFDQENAVGEDVQNLIVPEDEQAGADSLRRRLLAGEPVDREVRRRAADGLRDFRVQVTLREDASGPVEGYAIYTDITEEKRTQRRLEESEKRYRTLVESARDAILTIDSESTIRYANSAVEPLFGYTADELVGEPLTVLMPERHRESHLNAVERFVHTREETMDWSAVEFPGVRKNGEEIDLQISFSAYKHRGETRIQGMLRNVSERKEHERKLEEQERQLQQIKETVTEIIWISSPSKDEMHFISDAYEDITGRPPEELADDATKWLEAVHPDDREQVREALKLQGREPEAYEETYRILRPDGTVRWVRDRAAGVYTEDGELERIVGVATDITDRRKAEIELRETGRLLEKTLESLDEAVFVVNPADRTIRSCNAAVEQVFGYEPDELIGGSTEHLHIDRRAYEHFGEYSEKALNEEGVFESEYRMRRKDGDIIDTAHMIKPLQPGDRSEGVVSVVRDISEQKKRERQLRTREQKTAALYGALEQLLTAETRNEVARRIRTLASKTFGYPLNGVHFVKDDRLVPTEISSSVSDRMPQVPVPSLDGDSLGARAYRSGDSIAVNDLSEIDSEIDYGDLRSGACVPLGEHGVISVASTELDGIDEFDVQMLEILGAHAATVLDRIQQEETLREERDLLERIFEISPVAIVLFNREGEFVRASDRAEEVLGLEKDAVTSRSYNDPNWDITTPEGEPIPDEELPFARVVSTGEPVYDVEHTIAWPDDTRRLLSVSGAPLRDREGGIEGAVFHIEDVTERRAAERRLRQSEQRFRKIFENAAVGIVIGNTEGRVIRANPAFQQMMGYTQEELQGRHFQEFTHPDDSALNRRRFQELREGVRARDQGEKRYVRKDGSTFWGRLTISLFEGAGEAHHISLIEDVDEQKRYEENLRAAKAEAEEAARLKSAMLANMSHEIRTPLTSIIGFSELLAGELRDEQGELAERIHRSSHRLMNTLNSVLELSRLEAGAVELEREPVRLERLAKEAIDLLEGEAKAKTIDLAYTLPSGPVMGQWNEEAVRRIIQNLVDNAIKFTPSGGEVEVTIWKEESRAIVTVEDSGIGISKEAQDIIFDAFKQESEGLDREFEGSGLGLSITMRLVEVHGGTIEVESEKGVGSRFTVSLPFHDREGG